MSSVAWAPTTRLEWIPLVCSSVNGRSIAGTFPLPTPVCLFVFFSSWSGPFTRESNVFVVYVFGFLFCSFLLWLQADCPFIVCMTYAFHTPDKLCFVLDLMNGGDLHYHLSQHGVFNEQEMRFYAAEVILGKVPGDDSHFLLFILISLPSSYFILILPLLTLRGNKVSPLRLPRVLFAL